MKKLLFCGLYQKEPASSTYRSTGTRTTSTIKMATARGEQGSWYTAECREIPFTLPVRYQDLEYIGNGTFGAVIRATDTETGEYVAIKKMLRPFQTETDAKRTYRELKLLIDLNHPDAQIIQLYNVFTPEKDVNEFQTVYFVFNFITSDIGRDIKRRLRPIRLEYTELEIKKIVYSLLRSLKFMHSGGILHRDLKPVNIGIDEQINVTILDFGLARVVSRGIQTGYVATRWWRAPEVYINWERYDEKLDIWSVGCIMAELILLRPIFPGNDHKDQLNRIFDILGTPDSRTLNEICRPDTIGYISGLPPKSKRDFNELFGFKYDPGSAIPRSGVSPEGVDLIDRMLSFDHRKRSTTEEALAHPFLRGYHDPLEEPTVAPVIDEHQDAEYRISKWKSIIWNMVHEFVPPSWINTNRTSDSQDQTMH